MILTSTEISLLTQSQYLSAATVATANISMPDRLLTYTTVEIFAVLFVAVVNKMS